MTRSLRCIYLFAALGLLGSCGSATATQAAQPEAVGARGVRAQQALVIAIAEYPAKGGYETLAADADVPLVVGALERLGFEATVLVDDAATRAGILDALATLSSNARPGDAVAIHYSGHGHQLADDDGDEADGRDEVWVPQEGEDAHRRGHPPKRHHPARK